MSRFYDIRFYDKRFYEIESPLYQRLLSQEITEKLSSVEKEGTFRGCVKFWGVSIYRFRIGNVSEWSWGIFHHH